MLGRLSCSDPVGIDYGVGQELCVRCSCDSVPETGEKGVEHCEMDDAAHDGFHLVMGFRTACDDHRVQQFGNR